MNNQELEFTIKDILKKKNFFDMIETAYAFNPYYKKTDFYKNTKMSLAEVIKNAKIWYALQLDDVAGKIQSMLDSLDTSKLMQVIEDLGNVFSQENAEIMDIANSFKDIMG